MSGDDQLRLPVPLHIFLREVVELSKFTGQYFLNIVDENGKLLRFGLESARLPADTAARLLTLLAESQGLHTAWILVVDPNFNVEVRQRAEFVLGEIMVAVDTFLDDGVQDDNDVRFATLVTDHAGRGTSHAAMALALEDFTALALPLRAELDGFIGFDAALLDEAPLLAQKLRALPLVLKASAEADAAQVKRNAKLHELLALVQKVRRAARAVFRHQPEIAQQASSAWERQARAERARAARAANGNG
jgi:hypothetical protein